jgi:hypothetical protein
VNRQAIGILVAGVVAYLLWKRRPLIATVTTSEFIDTDSYLPGSTSYSEPIKRFARAVAAAEGYGIPGAIPTIANNPGDLVIPGWSPTLGAGIAVFDSDDYGWSRLYRQLALVISGQSSYYYLDMSIADMGRTWAGGDLNWARNVARNLNVSTDTPLWQVLA